MNELDRQHPGLATLLVLASALGLAACRDAASVASGAPPAGAEAPRPSTNRQLALARSPGESAIDREILALEQAIQKGNETSDRWVVLGRAWVRKARETADPGFYLNAKACAD